MSGPKEFAVLFSCLSLFVVQPGRCSEIIGGKEVRAHSLPFMALLEDKAPACGGILIDPSWVLTAAHCKSIRKVLLGVHSIKAGEKTSRQVRKVKKQYPHPCYDSTERVNDLMLLKLDKSVKQTATVKFFRLPKTVKDPADGTSCTVAGWGQITNDRPKMSDVLMSVNVTVIDRRKCNSQDHYNYSPVITKGMICAGSVGKKAVDSCGGDSGGPLLCGGGLAGLTSFGVKCGQINKPGVYTFLSEGQLAWIRKTTKRPSDELEVDVSPH